MASINHVRALMLEESLLHLLRHSGYVTIETPGTDKTLFEGKSGLEIQGRGEKHQIDAIADYKASPPFCNPVRLLVEGKFEKKGTGLDIVRNAVGVLKDLQEYFVPGTNYNDPTKSRYHYTYAIFSASYYSKPAQKYAFAQDIFLIPVARSKYFKPVIDSIKNIVFEDFKELKNKKNIVISLKDLRKKLRKHLRHNDEFRYFENESINQKFKTFIDACIRINVAYVAIAGKSFPILLIPNSDISVEAIYDNKNIRIFWDNEGWYIRANGVLLFSFDLPEEMFKLYAEQGVLTQEAAIDLKEFQLSEFRIINDKNNEFKMIEFNLDREWIQEIRNNILKKRGQDFRSRSNDNPNQE